MSDAKNVKLGACTISFGGVDLGFTKGGVEVDVTTETHPVTVDQKGDTVVSEFITKRNVKVTCPLAETTVDNLLRTMPGAEMTQSGGQNATATLALVGGVAVDAAAFYSGLADRVSAIEVNGVTLVYINDTLENCNDFQIPFGADAVEAIQNTEDCINLRNNSDAIKKFKADSNNTSLTLTSVQQGVSYNNKKIRYGKRAVGSIDFAANPENRDSITFGLGSESVTLSLRNTPDSAVKTHVKRASTLSETFLNIKGVIDTLVRDKSATYNVLRKVNFSYNTTTSTITVYAKTIGTELNSYFIAYLNSDDGAGEVAATGTPTQVLLTGASASTSGNTTTVNLANGSVSSTEAVTAGGVDPTFVGVSVKNAVGINLLKTAKELVLHPIDLGSEDTSEDLTIPLAATAGGVKFAYQSNTERVFNVEFMGYPNSETDELFKFGDVIATGTVIA